MSTNEPRVYQADIRATPERVWRSLTDPELTQKYYFGTRVESDWKQKSRVRYLNAKGSADVEGEVLEFDPPRRLVTTFRPAWAPDVSGSPASTVAWEITPKGSGESRLTLTHTGFAQPDSLRDAWQGTLAGLKQLLESSDA